MLKIINKPNRILSFASQSTGPRPRFLLSTFRLLFTFIFSFLISACGLDIEDPTPPSPPVWVEKSLPEEWPERGIDAHETNGIYLEWMPNPQNENISKYLVFRAEYFEVVDSLDNFIQIEIIDQQVPEITEYIDHLAVFGIRYYYKLKAEDRAGNVSLFSDSLTYKLLTREVDPKNWTVA